MKNLQTVLLLVMLVYPSSCQESGKASENRINRLIGDIREKHIPDTRTGIFEIHAGRSGNIWLIEGVTDHPESLNILLESLEQFEIQYRNEVTVLPSPELEGKIYGLVRVSVANLRTHPSHTAELNTQSLLGTPLKLLQKQPGWYRVQTPDRYIGWLDEEGLTPMDEDAFKQYRAGNKIIFTGLWGNSYTDPGADDLPVSDLVAGAVLEMAGDQGNYYRVRYPDGRLAYVRKSESEPFSEWIGNRDPDAENLVYVARQLMGVPYLWGGTSSKGVDCSGYTKTVYFLNGMILPRDASQQDDVGMLVDEKKYFNRLQPGDLLFFGSAATDSTAERVVHVGMWIGEMKYIHASGDVHISSMDQDDPEFDEYNYNRYLKSRRILNSQYMDQLFISQFY
ncbi:MAG: C40 family peptidase [Cyclobacteriaceae bacterium]|nr:C40 family peptidase [Cyclobacteriaceae bacterium]